MTEWQRMFAEAAKGKRNFEERAKAVQEASRRYHAGKGRRSRRRNPSGPSWPLLALGAGAVWLLFSGKLGGVTEPKK